ncbi:MAG: aspartate carbamoyltransferase regulatory subunit [Lachnospiraceae bacterium]|nr:aspartate carbamoyltransferase regulatory subunit [Lachnospiraceae bacterium]
MLNISGLTEGYVLDHIKAGECMDIYTYLGLDKLETEVALIKNVKSRKMGIKDIIKIDGAYDLNFNMLGCLDPNITIDVIRDGKIVEKKKPDLPEYVEGIIKCKNPRCITTIEQELVHRFKLTNKEKGTYRCVYCEQSFKKH